MDANPAQAPAYLVFGATGGIGGCLARRLSAGGGRLFLSAQNSERLESLARELRCPFHAADVRDSDAVNAAFAMAAKSLGPLDGVAHCVGSILLRPAHATSDAQWADTLALNLTSAFRVLRAAVGALRSPGGSVVLVSSAAAEVGLPNHEAIAAAKAGVIGLGRSAAATYAPRGIRVNVVSPGLTQTTLVAPLLENELSAKASLAMHPLGRLGEPADVAAAIAWLLDPEQSWVTGQVLGVDGGLATLRGRSAVR
ncbi:MAG: SDR family oxidoreductase [Pirellulales bacterium]